MVITDSKIEDNHLKISVFIPDHFKDHIARFNYELTDFEYALGGMTQDYTLERKSIINGELYHTLIINKGGYGGKHTIIYDYEGANEMLPGKIFTLEWNVVEILNGYDEYISGKIQFSIDTKDLTSFSTKSDTLDFRIRIYKKYTSPVPNPEPDPTPKPSKMILYIPEGIPNIQNLFKKIDFNKLNSWKIVVRDQHHNILATSRNNILASCNEIRVHFINSFGEIDSINLHKVEIVQEIKSDTWTKSHKFPLDRTKGGTYRNNITSNENYEAVTNMYGEHQQYWIKELVTSPNAWLEIQLPNGFLPSCEKDYIPIVISDVSVNERKSKDRYEYMVKIKFSMSNSNISHR